MTDQTCPACGVAWTSHLDREALCRESKLAADARDAALAYAVQLQQIIEAMCRGGTIPHQYLAHGQMAAEAMKTRAQEAVRLREIMREFLDSRLALEKETEGCAEGQLLPENALYYRDRMRAAVRQMAAEAMKGTT